MNLIQKWFKLQSHNPPSYIQQSVPKFMVFISLELTFNTQHLYWMYSKTLSHMVNNLKMCQRLLLFVQSWLTYYFVLNGWQANNYVFQRLVSFVESWQTSHSVVLTGRQSNKHLSLCAHAHMRACRMVLSSELANIAFCSSYRVIKLSYRQIHYSSLQHQLLHNPSKCWNESLTIYSEIQLRIITIIYYFSKYLLK